MMEFVCRLLKYWVRLSIFMPPTSKKFGRHIGVGMSVLLSVTLALDQEPLEIGS